MEISPDLGMNLLLGNNGQGKTSFIEACAYLCLGRSIRGNTDQQILRFNQDYFKLEGRFLGNSLSEKTTLKYFYNISDKEKKIFINEQPLRRFLEVIGIQKTVFFLADHLNIVKGPPNLRRNYLDVLIIQNNPKHYQDLLDYKKIIQHRNHTLRYNKNNRSINLQLDIWDDQLIELAGRIIFKRIDVINFIKNIIPDIHQYLTNNKEEFLIKYNSSIIIDFDESFNLEDIIKILRLSFNENRKKDIQHGITTIGPHRDDLFFILNGKEAKIFASQGQQRTIALSLKLAEINFFLNYSRNDPLVLLDDVFSELDKLRQKQLLYFLKKGKHQCFITSTSLDMIDKDWIEEAKVITVEKGMLK
jgi:DNA replication and repair protein RecF